MDLVSNQDGWIGMNEDRFNEVTGAYDRDAFEAFMTEVNQSIAKCKDGKYESSVVDACWMTWIYSRLAMNKG